VGFVGMSDQNVAGLAKEQSSQLLGTIFGSTNKKGYVVINGKAFLYDIVEQRLPNKSKLTENDGLLESNMRQIKGAEIRARLINILKPRYKIEQYYKG
jgi:peptidyl-prolyl cis-trans isomerase D